MTYAEETEVATVIGQLTDYESHCFDDQDEAQEVVKEARFKTWSWSQANLVVLAHHNLTGFVVRVVSTPDNDVGVIFKSGETVPLDVLRDCVAHRQSPWAA